MSSVNNAPGNLDNSAIRQAVELLRKSGAYKVLPVITPEYNDVAGFSGAVNKTVDLKDVHVAVVLDTETTGADISAEILQISMIKYRYIGSTGEVIDIIDRYNGYQQPSKPISPEITALTGITDDMVAGKRIDQQEVCDFIGDALVVAHSAEFDRGMMERNMTEVQDAILDQNWACTLNEVDWKQHGFSNSKLDYLAFMAGYAYDAHRADVDCEALLRLLDSKLGDTRVMKMIHDSANQRSHRIWAVSSPFSTKDALKARGYSWSDGTNGGHKAWNVTVVDGDLKAEMEWLQVNVYGRGRHNPAIVDTMDASMRYSWIKSQPGYQPAPSKKAQDNDSRDSSLAPDPFSSTRGLFGR